MKRFDMFKRKFYNKLLEVNTKMNAPKNTEGMIDISIAGVIGFAIGLIVLASVLPTAMDVFYQTNTSSWDINGQEDTKTVLLWWLIPLIVVAVVLIMLYDQIRR